MAGERQVMEERLGRRVTDLAWRNYLMGHDVPRSEGAIQAAVAHFGRKLEVSALTRNRLDLSIKTATPVVKVAAEAKPEV